MQLNPYLTLYAGTPAEQQVPSEWRNKIIHARLAVGNEVLMGSDAPPERYEKSQGFSVTLGVDDRHKRNACSKR